MEIAKVVGTAGVVAGLAAAVLAGLDMTGWLAHYPGDFNGLYLVLLAGSIALLGGAWLHVAVGQQTRRTQRAVRTAFAAGVDYGMGKRSRVSVHEILEDAA